MSSVSLSTSAPRLPLSLPGPEHEEKKCPPVEPAPIPTDSPYLIWEESPSLEEHIIPLKSHVIYSQYSRAPDSMEINLGGRILKVVGISAEEADRDLKNVLGDVIEPAFEREKLKEVFRIFCQKEPRFQEKATRALEYLSAKHMVTLAELKFALGEEFYKRVVRNLPMVWKISKNHVPKLHQWIEQNIKALGERYDVDDPQALDVLKKEEERIRKMFSPFEKIEDYFIDEDLFPFLIPLTQKPWPRLERVKQALRHYFKMQELRENSPGKMPDGEETDWEEIEAGALTSLENVCIDVELGICFGRNLTLGAPRNPYFDIDQFTAELSEHARQVDAMMDQANSEALSKQITREYPAEMTSIPLPPQFKNIDERYFRRTRRAGSEPLQMITEENPRARENLLAGTLRNNVLIRYLWPERAPEEIEMRGSHLHGSSSSAEP